ncbi:hypothetical protein BJS_04247 [Bradyrhizobium japonicum SEMIA 5079]|nr:hypothetical protein BJS_04247 [Bradyrhizobium japonicum SEMIA 5079]
MTVTSRTATKVWMIVKFRASRATNSAVMAPATMKRMRKITLTVMPPGQHDSQPPAPSTFRQHRFGNHADGP